MVNIELNKTSKDDSIFIQMITKIVNAVVVKSKPKHVAVIKIDNWFDHKWLQFSGKFLGALGLWKKELTLPPFNPNRVVSQTVYELTENVYGRVEAPAIHIWQQSDQNFKRKISEMTNSDMFIWFSSNTVKNSQGSLMVYSQSGNECIPWFVSFEKATDWKINKAKGISVQAVKECMA